LRSEEESTVTRLGAVAQAAPQTRKKYKERSTGSQGWPLSGMETMNEERNSRNKIHKGQSERGTFLIEQTLDPSGNPGPRNPLPSCPVLIERAFCSQPNILVFLFLYQPPELVPSCVVPPSHPPLPLLLTLSRSRTNYLSLTPNYQYSTTSSLLILFSC
jgi:hypothetical protein